MGRPAPLSQRIKAANLLNGPRDAAVSLLVLDMLIVYRLRSTRTARPRAPEKFPVLQNYVGEDKPNKKTPIGRRGSSMLRGRLADR